MRHSLLYTTLELEATIASAKEEITRRECELIRVNDLLSRVMKERDEAQAKCQKLMLEKLELQKKQQLEQHQFVQTHQRDTISQSEEETQRDLIHYPSGILLCSHRCVQLRSEPGMTSALVETAWALPS